MYLYKAYMSLDENNASAGACARMSVLTLRADRLSEINIRFVRTVLALFQILDIKLHVSLDLLIA